MEDHGQAQREQAGAGSLPQRRGSASPDRLAGGRGAAGPAAVSQRAAQVRRTASVVRVVPLRSASKVHVPLSALVLGTVPAPRPASPALPTSLERGSMPPSYRPGRGDLRAPREPPSRPRNPSPNPRPGLSALMLTQRAGARRSRNERASISRSWRESRNVASEMTAGHATPRSTPGHPSRRGNGRLRGLNDNVEPPPTTAWRRLETVTRIGRPIDTTLQDA